MAVAVVTGHQYAHFSASVQDGLGTRASAIVYTGTEDTATVADFDSAFEAWIAALDAATDGIIVDSSMVIKPVVTGLKADFTTDDFLESRVEQTAVLNMRNASNNRRFGVAIPAVADAAVVHDKVDLTNAAIAAMVTLLHGGAYTNLFGQALTALVDSILSFRKRRKSLGRSSFELPA